MEEYQAHHNPIPHLRLSHPLKSLIEAIQLNVWESPTLQGYSHRLDDIVPYFEKHEVINHQHHSFCEEFESGSGELILYVLNSKHEGLFSTDT